MLIYVSNSVNWYVLYRIIIVHLYRHYASIIKVNVCKAMDVVVDDHRQFDRLVSLANESITSKNSYHIVNRRVMIVLFVCDTIMIADIFVRSITNASSSMGNGEMCVRAMVFSFLFRLTRSCVCNCKDNVMRNECITNKLAI